MNGPSVNRRELLAAGAGVGVALALHRTAFAQSSPTALDFAAAGTGEGWPGWHCPCVANLRRDNGLGVLEAGSDVFPCDPRPVAFALDQRFRDGEIQATLRATGAGAGVVLRRVSPRHYYAALYDEEARALVIVRRWPQGLHELARTTVTAPARPIRLSLSATGIRPTELVATLDAGVAQTVEASDSSAPLQRPGDPGVLATAKTFFPSEGPAPVPALGNLHLLPYGVQEGQAVIGTPAGQQVLATIRERSTAAFEKIEIRPATPTHTTRPSVIAATAAPRGRGRAVLKVATDVPAEVDIEISPTPDFRRRRVVKPGQTDDFQNAIAQLTPKRRGRIYWRARLKRGRRRQVGPTRSFRPLSSRTRNATIAIGSCAVQFGPMFDHIAAAQPDAFVWQGDLNYPDTLGPLAQTVPGYAGIWRDFLANPRMQPILEHSLFAAQRDDHDYGVQDVNSTNLVPHGLTPWQSLMEHRTYYRFSAGPADFWVLDQRLHKSDPKLPEDDPNKTLLGTRQRNWLLRTLASSKAPFKVICSPCTLAPLQANARDGSWAEGFTKERDLVLAHIKERTSGRTLFVTGDTHWTMVYDHDGLFEARPCPLGIPTPNDITLTQPNAAEEARRAPGVTYADDEKGHVALIRTSETNLDLSLLKEDGTTAYTQRF